MKYFIFFAFLFLVSSQNILGQCIGSIHGHVYKKKGKVSLPNVTAQIPTLNLEAKSNQQGEFLFEGVCEGTYLLKVFREEFDTLWVSAKITSKTPHFHQDIFLETPQEVLEGIEIFQRKDAPISSQTQQYLSNAELEASRGKTLGDMLKNIAGVNALNTGAGISKPMIHGLHSQRVLILNNGVRQEGQQWGEEHAPEIDPFVAEQVAVIKGAAGVRYGSDAMGGVVVLNPKPLTTSSQLSGKAYLIGHSNGRMGNMAFQLQKAFGKGWAWNFQSSVKKGGDFHTPTYILSNTGVQDLNFSGTIGYTKENWNIQGYFSRFDSEIGILRASHTGNINDLALSISRPQPWYVAPFTYEINNPRQKIVHYLGKINAEIKLNHIGTLSLQYAFQDNARKEYDIRRAGRSVMPALSLVLQSHNLEAVLEHHAWRDFRGSFGINTLYQTNYNVPETGIVPLLPNFTNFTQGIFWVERFIKPKYDLEWGIRYDYRHTEVRTFVQNRTYIKPNYQFNYFTGTIGYSYFPNDSFTFKTNIGATFRPPHTAELFSQGLHLGIGNIQEGLLFENGFLNPQRDFSIEQSYKWVASFSYKKKNWILDVQPYYNIINNFIYLTPTDIRLTIRGIFPVFSYVQDDISMRGIDLTSIYKIGKWGWQSKFAYLDAHIQQTKEALINMPPLRWENKLFFEQKKWKNLENIDIFATLLHISKQSKAPRVISPTTFENITSEEQAIILAGGNFDFMEAPSGYTILGFGMQASYKKFTFSGKVENVTNLVYRDYLNRWRYYANDLGRNYIIQLNYKF
jgi:iron complex outermembrane receptor protein